GHLKIGVSVRHIFKPISYLEIQLLSGVSGGYIRGCILPLYLASTLGKKRIIQAEGAGYRNLFPSLTTQSMRFLHASRRAGAIFSHSCVAHTLFGSPNFTVRALPCEKIATSDAQI
ncbi:MAG: hypothetical protein E7D17_05580, partial [Citrobacter freundii]|nr:hypothetical protein [Citrobacter freundii]